MLLFCFVMLHVLSIPIYYELSSETYVSNSPDGTVYIFVEGSPKRITEFLHEIEKGPTMARVERMEVHDVPAEGNYGSFSIEGW
jgi:acylphosphatase